MNDRQTNLYEIRKYLAHFTSHVSLESESGNFDISKEAESFFIPILNCVFEKTFTRTEYGEKNTAAIDLISSDGSEAIQITSQKGYSKIRKTLEKFISNKLYEKSTLTHLIVHPDYETSKKESELESDINNIIVEHSISPKPIINFTLSNIWNIGRLIIELEKKATPEQLQSIRDSLRSLYGSVMELPGFNEILIPYEIYYEDKLKSEITDDAPRFINPFFGREKELEGLKKFVEDSSIPVIAIVADGGFGKTRLCIEYFQKNSDPNVKLYVYNEPAFIGQLFPGHQPPSGKVIILVDDAHRKSTKLESLIANAKLFQDVKVILTIRNPLLEETLRQLPSHERNIPDLPVKPLSYDESLALIRHQLPGTGDHQRKKMAEQSKGIPIVILSLCQMVVRGKYSAALSGEEIFGNFVRELKDQVIEDISSKYYIDKKHINDIIELVSLCAPVNNSEDEITSFAKLSSIDFETCSIILDYLQEYNFVQKRALITLQADPYGDVILLGMAPRIKFIVRREGIDLFFDRIIRNLVSAEFSQKLKVDVNSIILEFISSIKSNSLKEYKDIRKFKNNVETINHFVYQKPLLGVQAIDTIIECTNNVENFWQTDSLNRYKEVNDAIDSVISTIALGARSEQELTELLRIVKVCSEKRNSLALLSKTFRYREFDFSEYYITDFPCHRQQFLIKEVSKIISSTSITNEEGRFVYSACKLLLSTEYRIEEHFDARTLQISYGTASVIDNKITKFIRKQAIDSLIQLYSKFRSTELGDSILQTLLITFSFTRIPDDKKYVLDESQQVEQVLAFLNKLFDDSPTTAERSALTYYLDISARRAIKPEYQITIYKDLREKAQTAKTPKERMSLLIRREFMYKKKNFITEANEIINEYRNQEDFIRDAISIRKEMKDKEANYFRDLSDLLVKQHQDLAKNLFEAIKKDHPELILAACDLICANYSDKDYFYENISTIWSIGTENAKHQVIWLLTSGRNREVKELKKEDLKYFETVILEQNRGALNLLSVVLPNYLEEFPDEIISLSLKFLELDEGNDKDFLIHSLFEESPRVEKFKDKLKALAFSTIKIRIGSHYRDEILVFLENHFGFTVMFDYFKQAVEWMVNEFGSHVIDLHDSAYSNPAVKRDQRENDIIYLIDWFCQLQNPSEYVEGKIISYFSPGDLFTDQFKGKLETFISKSTNERNFLLKLSLALKFLNRDDESVFAFLISIANRITKLAGYEKNDLYSIFNADYIENLEGRQGYGVGQPFPQDVKKKEYLNKILSSYSMEEDVKNLIGYSLERTISSIERKITRDTPEW